MTGMYERSIREEFTHQTDTFARAGALKAAETLGALVELAPPDPEARWLEVACGPAMVGRELAPKVGSVRGVDLTPAMIEKAREEADREDLGNVEFGLGDATALEFEDAGAQAFRVLGEGGERRLFLHNMLFRWRRPA